jgi:hypothetical protein
MTGPRAPRGVGAILIACALVFGPALARADAGWLEAGDTGLRIDLQLLVDAEVIRLPVNQWPIPRAAVRYALANAKEHFATNAAVSAALARVRARVADRPSRLRVETILNAGDAGLMRDFDTIARENGEVGARAEYSTDRFAVGASVVGVIDPDDGQDLRADGSHATLQLGNWLVGVNTLDRWWGPGHEGSLILSSNARPMPTFMVERAEARPFGWRALSWLGPWRFSFGVSEMESHRVDIDRPLFMAMRATVMPFKDIELGFSRTAQFCGQELECNLNVFGNLLAGNDNVGIDATAANEPGNQMAGFDIRWNSPIGRLPYAIYSQFIGEDESSYLPAKYLGMFGLEGWKPFANGDVVQLYAEYANTICSGLSRRTPYYNCAYTQGRFNYEGYRYRGRVIGYSTDNDAESYALGARYETARGEWWTLTARAARLNNDAPDERNTIAPVPMRFGSLEAGWHGKLFGEPLSVQVGVQSREPQGADRAVEPYGFIGWRHGFSP